jgi:DNA-binding response OmpR family regulator
VGASLLLAETEPETRSLLERHLRSDGFDVLGADGGREALLLAERERPDLVLLGCELPDEPGLEVCRRLREGEPGRSWDRDVPVIVLGELEADLIDRVRAFERGCDDFVGRPVQYEELRARIRAVLRRSTSTERDVVVAGELEIERHTRTLRVRGQPVQLATKELELLLALARDPERVFTKEELLRLVWCYRGYARTRTLDSHASRLRCKIAAVTDTQYVLNVWGVGYRLLLPA